MVKNLSDTLAKYANGWLILFSFGIMFFCMAVLLPQAEARIKAAGASGPIDLMVFPTPEKSFAVVAALGDVGRAEYRVTELSTDIVYPISYTAFYSLLITFLLRQALDKNNPVQLLNVLPIGALVFDLLENVGIITLLSIYPARSLVLEYYLMIVNGIKWGFAGASVLGLILGLVLFLWQKIRKR